MSFGMGFLRRVYCVLIENKIFAETAIYAYDFMLIFYLFLLLHVWGRSSAMIMLFSLPRVEISF
jgi:hypothetical protein